MGNAEIVFGGDIRIDAYQFPDGEIRYSLSGASRLVGLASNYLAKLQSTKNASGSRKSLLGKGFTEYRRTGIVKRSSKRGASKVETVSGSDLDAFVRFAGDFFVV